MIFAVLELLTAPTNNGNNGRTLMIKNAPKENKEQNMKYHNITIFKNKKCNTYYCRYRMNYKQHYISGKTQIECVNKLKNALNLPRKEKANEITFIDWYNRWFELFKKGKVKDTTISEYNSCLKKLDNIKNQNIRKITSIDVITILNNITAERTKQKVYELLNTVFKKALDYKIIKDNIMDVIEKSKHKRKEGIALTKNQQQIFIEECHKHPKGDLYLIILYQGLRIGEMLALETQDIDFDKKTISINKSLNKFNKIDDTKNTQSNRIIPIFDKTLPILEKFKNIQGRLFNFTYKIAQVNLKKIIANKLPDISLHDLRHTFITNCENLNIPEHIIQRLVGHEIGSKVTKQIYTHFNLEDNLSYIDKLNT